MDDPTNASISDDGRPEAQFGAELRLARERADLSLRALARAMHRAHSSLVEYERGNRLAPVDVVRDYESALGLKADTLVALRNEAHAQRRALGRDGDLPDAARPGQTHVNLTSDGDLQDAARQTPPDLTSDTSGDRTRLWLLGLLSALAGAVAVAVAVLVVDFGPADRADKTMPSAPTQGSSSPPVTIGAPPRYQVQRCTQFSGTGSLPPGTALILGIRNLDNGDPQTYFAQVVSWSVAPGQGDWGRNLYFGSQPGQKYAVNVMVVAESAVKAIPNKDDPTTWAAKNPPPTTELVTTVYVTRRSGEGDC